MRKESNSKKVLLVFMIMLGLAFIAIGTTYAFFTYSKDGIKTVTLNSSNAVKLHYQEGANQINIPSGLPMDDTRGKTQTDYFEFTITGKTSTFAVPYIIAARVSTIDANRIPASYITVYLTEVNNNDETQVLFTTYDQLTQISKNNHIEDKLYDTTIPVNTSDYSKTYRLRVWINETADFTPTEDEFGNQTYPMEGKEFALTVNVYTEAEEQQACHLAFEMADPELGFAVGEEVRIGNEYFYVISTNEDTTTLLAKNNLAVYNYATPVGSEDDLQFAYRSSMTDYNPYVPFSSTNYWNDGSISDYSEYPYVYNSNLNAEPQYGDYSFFAPLQEDFYPIYIEKNFMLEASSDDDCYHDNIGCITYNSTDYYFDWDAIESYYSSRYNNFTTYSTAENNNYKYNSDGVALNAFRDSWTSVEDYSIAFYVQRYKNKLETMGATISNARLLTYQEYETITATGIKLVSNVLRDYFWLGNASDEYDIYYVGYNNELTYASGAEAGIRPVIEVPTCSIDTGNGSTPACSKPKGGDKYCFNSECFIVLESQCTGNTTLLAERSLNTLGKENYPPTGLQRDYFRDSVVFASNTYWTNNAYTGDYDANTETPYPYVYDASVLSGTLIENTYNNKKYYTCDSNSTGCLASIINNYLTTIKTSPYNVPASTTTRLITKEELDRFNKLYPEYCSISSDRVRFWTGSAASDSKVWAGECRWNGLDVKKLNYNSNGYDEEVGIRPLIIMPTSDLPAANKVTN